MTEYSALPQGIERFDFKKAAKRIVQMVVTAGMSVAEITAERALRACVADHAARLEQVEQQMQAEREHLHLLLADALGLISPDTDGELVDRINAVLTRCGEKCVGITQEKGR